MYSWFESYLHNRSQSVSINCGTSDKFHTKYGVPQDPVLALYCLSYNQANCLRSSNVTYPMCTPTPTTQNCIYPSMPILELGGRPLYRQCSIADIRKWMLQDRLRLNDDKTEFIMIGTRQKLAKVNIYPMQVGESSIA